MDEINSVTFTPEEVKKGLHLDLIKYLLDYTSKSETSFNDIHITTDDAHCCVIEWSKNNYYEKGIHGFRYIDEEHSVFKEVVFPDNHIEYLHDYEEPAAIEDWWQKHVVSNAEDAEDAEDAEVVTIKQKIDKHLAIENKESNENSC